MSKEILELEKEINKLTAKKDKQTEQLDKTKEIIREKSKKLTLLKLADKERQKAIEEANKQPTLRQENQELRIRNDNLLRLTIYSMFNDGKSYNEIAKIIDVTPERVKHVHGHAKRIYKGIH